ncbi:M56 family metallopeptidase [Tundrisphaera lichenicola]|uniref:M56 family metallopeptidase n=1 Tax=Tundrisphaera lichenicola TaxID=2029860 RepID=UPI003EBF6F0D
MTSILVSSLDRAALLLWLAGLQFGLLGIGLLIPIALWRRRPAVRHFLAMSALIAFLASPISAACLPRWGLGWFGLERSPGRSVVAREPIPARSVVEASPPSPRGPDLPGTPEPSPSGGDLQRDESGPIREEPIRVVETLAPASGLVAPPPAREPVRPSDRAAPAASLGSSLGRVVLRGGLIAWFAGVLVMATRGLRARGRLNRLIQAARPVEDDGPIALLRRIATEQGLGTPPRLLASEVVASPFVVEARGPLILVPSSLLTPDSGAMLGHVLAHECAHVARRDLLIGRIQGWAETLGWPHPFVRLFGAILDRAREDLCDNRVLLRVRSTDYARTLLTLGERLSGLSTASAISMFPRRHSLGSRIAGLLDSRRDPAERLGGLRKATLAALVLSASVVSAGVGPSRNPVVDPEALGTSTVEEPVPPDLVRALADRSKDWIGPPAGVASLEYDFLIRSEVTPIRVARGDRRRESVWMGATLNGGFRELLRSPDRFELAVERQGDPKVIRLVARVKDPAKSFRVEVGNGVENSWMGYFAHPATSTSIVVDADRLVPLEEQSGSTLIRYADWREVGPGRWVPLRVDVVGASDHYRMTFEWLGEALWLLGRSESITPEGTRTLTRTENVRVDGRAVVVPETDAERRSREAAAELRRMLDHNRPWLDPGETGAGWRPSFRTLSYTFRTVREDVRESCVLDREGRAAFEVSFDGLGKMGDRLGERQVTLDTPEFARALKGGGFARLYPRPDRDPGQPTDLALKQFARMGCQLDLPLFRYRDRLDSASVVVEDGAWDGRACRVATVSNLGGGAYLGSGTMFAFSSWSYMHHIDPTREVLYLDPERQIPIHETLTSSRDGTFEIDFGDPIEVAPGQWAPRTIRIESPGKFTCEYRFQIVNETHWMLAEVTSWFDPKDRSRGVVEDLRIDGDRALLDDTLRQVEASRALFGGAGEPDRRVEIATVPFALGRSMRAGPYEIRVTTPEMRSVAVSVSTDDPDAPGTVPLGFLNARGRLLFAPSITLEGRGGQRRGESTMLGSEVWGAVRWLAVPTRGAVEGRLSMAVVPLRWGEPIAVNIPDAREGDPSQYQGKGPRAALTRAFRVQADRADDGKARITLDLVSIDGMHEFLLDLAAALLGADGELLGSGSAETRLRVESDPVEQRYTIDLGPILPGAEPRFLGIGVAHGNVISAPMGSTWGTFLSATPPFPIETLLEAPDDSCRRVGLATLGDRDRMERTIEREFLGDRPDDRWLGDGPFSRRTILRPLAGPFTRIIRESRAADLRSSAARFLAYSEAEGAVESLEGLSREDAPEVRDAAAVGLTFLGRDGSLDRIGMILGRDIAWRPNMPEAEVEAWRASRRLEQAALVALLKRGSDTAVDLLGETLLRDLDGLRLVNDEQRGEYLDGRKDRAETLVRLLGRAGKPRAVRWLDSAVDRVGRRPELVEHFGVSELAESMMKYPEQAGDRIRAEIASGPSPGAWTYALEHGTRNPAFIPAVRDLFRRDDVPGFAKYHAVLYLWNVEDPEAVEALRLAYDLKVTRDEPQYWLRLCEALAARGDGRGLLDAFEALVELERPAQPPADEKGREDWEKVRMDRKDQAEEVFGRASKEMLEGFVIGKREVEPSEERRVVLRLLWRLPGLPGSFEDIVPRWAEGSDPQVVGAARRLLDRD